MKKFIERADLENDIDKNPFTRTSMDRYHIQILHEYRVAAAFAVAVLNFLELKDNRSQQVVKEVLAECEAVLKDETIYDIFGDKDPDISKELELAVKKADDAIAHAGNLCNNWIPRFPEKHQPIVMQSRDICDKVTRRNRYGMC